MSKVSVVMATYNGEKFIEEQLESIRQQSRAVDEVLIADDCSTDRTVEVIRNFIDKYKLQHWFVTVNQKNVGWKRNFTNLIFQASGDIIFYCDQDDIWLLDKVRLMASILEKSEDYFCLSSHSIAIDGKGKLLDKSFNENASESGNIKKVTSNDSQFFYPLGCTLAFRKELLMYIDRSFYVCGTDLVIARTAILLNGMYDIDLSLIKHRFHQNNVSNSLEKLKKYYGYSTIGERMKNVEEDILYFSIFAKVVKKYHLPLERELCKHMSFAQRRANILKKRNIFSFIYSFLVSGNFFIRYMLIADLLYAFKLNRFVGRICNGMNLNLRKMKGN